MVPRCSSSIPKIAIASNQASTYLHVSRGRQFCDVVEIALSRFTLNIKLSQIPLRISLKTFTERINIQKDMNLISNIIPFVSNKSFSILLTSFV